jgi:hypothetical protein
VRWPSLPHFGTESAITHEGTLAGVHGWSELGSVLTDADLVLLGCPVTAHASLLEHVLPAAAAQPSCAVGTLYAQGGFDWHVRRIAADRGLDLSRTTVFGFKRFPFLATLERYGQASRLHGRFVRILLALDDPNKPRARGLDGLLREVFERPVERVSHFLACTLNLSNQVLHPGIAWGLLEDQASRNFVWSEAPPFYGSCSAAAAGMMNDLTFEIRSLAERLEPVLGLPIVRHLGSEPSIAFLMGVRERTRFLERFGVARALRDEALARGFRSNARLAKVRLPVVPAPSGEGFVANFKSRMWTDDIPNGLCVLQGMAEIVGMQLPRIEQMIHAHQAWMGKSYLVRASDGRSTLSGTDLAETNAPQVYGVRDEAGLRAFVRT